MIWDILACVLSFAYSIALWLYLAYEVHKETQAEYRLCLIPTAPLRAWVEEQHQKQ